PPAAGNLSASAEGVVFDILERLRSGRGPEAPPFTLAERRAVFHRALRPRRGPGSGGLVATVPAFSYTYLDAADRERLRVDLDRPDMVGRGRDRSRDPVVRSVRRARGSFGPVHPSRLVTGPGVYEVGPWLTIGIAEPEGGI